jgi:NADH-quinone oxidoreductase subunit J
LETTLFAHPVQWILGAILVLSSLGVVVAQNPVFSSLSFLVTLISLAAFYLQLHAEFVAVMQVLVYAGAILVIFIFVIILFQDAHAQIALYKPKSSPLLLYGAAGLFILTILLVGRALMGLTSVKESLPEGFGSAEALGKALYVDFFFPFEAVVLLFLIAMIGAFYIGRKEV